MSFDGPEPVAHLASALVDASPAMTSVVRLRFLPLAGSVAFVVDGAPIASVRSSSRTRRSPARPDGGRRRPRG